MPLDIEWASFNGRDSVRQSVYFPNGNFLTVTLTKERVTIDLFDDGGDCIGTESATYEEMADGLSNES